MATLEELQRDAVQKLSAQELSALVSPVLAVALAGVNDHYGDDEEAKASSVAGLGHHARPFFRGPLKWMGPNGETYDDYCEYMRAVWKVIIPGCEEGRTPEFKYPPRDIELEI